jgi:hypothetical protein
MFQVMFLLIVAGAIWLLPTAWSQRSRQLMLGMIALHVVGSLVRMSLMVTWYGRGDFLVYYSDGLEIAEALRRLDSEPFFASPSTWGTAFIQRVSGLVLFVVGPSIRAEFAVFSMFSTTGLILLAVSGVRAFRGADSRRLVLLLLAWPSLLFWPSSIGKEALILLAVGLVVYGWWGDGQRARWRPIVAGIVLAMLIRPHIALMFGIAVGFADWLAPFRRMTAGRAARGIVLFGAALIVTAVSLRQLGVEADQEAIQNFISDRSARTAQGGSAFTSPTGAMAVPMAFVNVLGRPFPWEAHNALALLSSLEVVFFWGLLWHRRAGVRVMVRRWRENRLLLLLVPLTGVLILFYGAFVSNMGILARQRVVVLPLMFLIAEAAPSFGARRPEQRPAPRLAPP